MANKQYWLIKTEPDVYTIAQFKREKVTQWTEVRNYQARNNLREMKVGDEVLVYSSNDKPNAIIGVVTVAKVAYADPTQFDSKSDYFDPKATKAEPRWFGPDLKFKSEFKPPVTIEKLKAHPVLKSMMLFKNSRLSVQPVTAEEFAVVSSLT